VDRVEPESLAADATECQAATMVEHLQNAPEDAFEGTWLDQQVLAPRRTSG